MARLQRQKSNNNLEPLMYLPLRGNLNGTDRNGSFTATPNGPVRWKPRAGGTINYLTNPSVETALNVGGGNWRDDSVNDTVTRDTTTAYSGSASAKCVSVAGGMYSGIQIIQSGLSLNGESEAVASAYVKGNGASLNGCLWRAIYSDASFYNSPVVPITLTDEWQRVVIPGTPDPAKTISSLTIFLIQPATGNVAQTFWADAAQFEYGTSDATPYIDGDSENCQWINLKTYMPATAHASASAHVEYFAEEATTNLIPNPRFATGTAGWSAVTRDTSWAYIGAASALFTRDAFTFGPILFTTLAALPYTVSTVIRNNAAAARTFQIRYNGVDFGAPTVIGAGAVGLVVGSDIGPDVGSKILTVYATDGVSGESFNIGFFQLEQKAYATSYCDGSLGTGYAWTGTPHNSASSRANAYLTLPDAAALGINSVRGALALRARNHTNPINNGAFFHYGNYNGSASKDHMQLRVGSANDRVVLFWQSGLSAFTAGTLLTAIGDDPHTFIVNWDGVASTFWMDNANATTTPRVAPIGDVSGQTVGIGSYNTSNANNSISDVIVFDRPLTQGERERLAAMPSWDYDVLFTQPSGLERTRYTTKLQREAQGDSRKLVRASRSPQLVRSAHTKESPMLFFDSANGTSTYETSSGTAAYSLAGPIRYVPAKDARVNYIKNPSFETGVHWWIAQSSTLVRSSDVAHSGAYSGKVTVSVTNPLPLIVTGLQTNTQLRVDTGKTYTFSAWLYNGMDSDRTIRVSLYQAPSSGGAAVTSYNEVTATLPPKTWKRVSVTRTITQGPYAAVFIYPNYGTNPFVVGESFYIDDVMFEEGAAATEYFSGKWWNAETNEAGTPHNSASVTALARLYLEDTVNYIQNPSFETNATHWGNGSAGTIVERDTTRSYKGSACGKITNTLGSPPVTSCVNQMPVVLNDVVSVQCRILGTPGIGANGRIRIRVLNSGGSTIKYIEGTVTDMDGTWQHLSLSYKVDEATAAAVTLYFAGNDTVNPYYIDAAQLEKKIAITEYVDGSMGVGTAWLGTANSSMSQRSTDTITNMAAAHAPNPAKGSFATWVFVRPEFENQHMFFLGSYGSPNTNCAQLYFGREATKNVVFSWYNSNIEIRQVVTTSGAPSNQWAFVYAEWDENNFSVSINNAALVTTTNRTYYPNWGASTNFYIGSYFGYGGGTQFNSYFFDRPLTAAERTALYNNPRSGAKVFAQKQMKLRRD